MAILIVWDTPPVAGTKYRDVLESILDAFQVDYEHTWLFDRGVDLKKMKASDWLEPGQEVLSLADGFDKILCLGAVPAAAVFQSDHTLPPTRVRGRGLLSPSGHYVICTYNPSTVVKDTDYFRDVVFDIAKLLDNDAPMPQPEIEIEMVEYKKDLKSLRDLHGASYVACDIETTSLNPYDADILGIGFAAETADNEGYCIVIPQKHIGEDVHKFLRTYKGTLVFHNALFDVQHLWRKFGRFDIQNLADTMLMHWALDERPFNRYRSHGLDLLQRLYFDAPPKSLHMKDWLAEYFREDVGDKARWQWVEDFCEQHAEMARTAWREWYEWEHGEQPDWKGKKVGRDISVETVFEAVCWKRMPEKMLPPPDEERKAEMWDEMMRYMGMDCLNTVRLFPILKKEMDDESPRLWNLHENYLIPATKALAQMRLNGAPVDIPYLTKLKVEIETQLAEEMVILRALVQEHTAHPKGEEFNPNSPKQVEEVLYSKEIGLGLQMPKAVGRYAYKRDDDKLTTNSDTLKVLARQVAKKRPAIAKLINLVLSYRVKSKIIGTYIDGILERVDPDGRVRADTNLHGTATGRTSNSNPNLQNIPDASHVGFDIRKAYIPSDGWVILEADYSQLELRVAGLFSQDPVLIEAYKNGADIHQEVALLLWNKPKDQITKYERYLAKCMNFGVLYGRGARSIATGPEMDNLVEMSGRSWNNKEIDAYFAKFKVGYKQLFDWMDLVKKDSMKKQYVEGPYGNRRRFDLILDSERGHIERQTVNSPIQGFAAQIAVNAIVELDKIFDLDRQRILSTVHDSILIECVNDPEIIRETAYMVKTTMEEKLPTEVFVTLPVIAGSPWKEGDRLEYNLPFVADVVIGPNWGEAHSEVEHLPAVPGGIETSSLA
jgi:DNA polymerase I - 3''-5'' exonuclease and polymerase domains